jgi:hypothetical protein
MELKFVSLGIALAGMILLVGLVLDKSHAIITCF